MLQSRAACHQTDKIFHGLLKSLAGCPGARDGDTLSAFAAVGMPVFAGALAWSGFVQGWR